MGSVSAQPRVFSFSSALLVCLFLGFLFLGSACSTSPEPVLDEAPAESVTQADEEAAEEEELPAGDYLDRARRSCIDGEYASCCQIMSDEESEFLEVDHDFAEVYLRGPCLSGDRSFDACTYLGVALHLQAEGRGSRARDFLRVACFGGERDACQWLSHLGAELRGVPVDSGDYRLDSEDFERGCGFRQ